MTTDNPTTAPKTDNDPLFIGSLARSFELLEVFAGNKSELTMSELRQETGLTFQTVQRITNTLIHLGYLQKQHRGKTFRLTLKTLDLQHRFLSSNQQTKLAWPVLVHLRQRTQQRVSFCKLDDTEIIYLLRLKGAESDFQTSLVGGRRLACQSAGGCAILSQFTAEQRLDILKRSIPEKLTPNSVTEPDVLLARIENSKKLGYCITEQETLLGEIDAAVAVVSSEETVQGAIVVSAPIQSHPKELFERDIVPLMRIAARNCAL